VCGAPEWQGGVDLSSRVWYLTLRRLMERGCPRLLYGEGFTSCSMMCAGRSVTEIDCRGGVWWLGR